MRRHKHSLSHYKLLTGEMGRLYPIGCVEVLPGDTFQHQTSMLLRVSPLVSPVMHPVQVRIHHWFVPNRIIWDDWEDFITGGTTPVMPTINTTNVEGDLLDHLGATPTAASLPINELPVRAYNKIVNEWYRDQDLTTEIAEDSTAIFYVAWEKDFYTAARPWTQKGDAVTLPVGTKAPIMGLGKDDTSWASGSQTVHEAGGVDTTYTSYRLIEGSSAGGTPDDFYIEEDPDNAGYPNLYADLSAAEALDVRDFRLAFALQRYQEARARYGSRYTEYLRYLGVRSSDARLQRPEYLGGGRQTISFSEVLQTAPDSGTSTVVGELKGHGISALRSNRYRRFFEEHGWVLTLASVRPKSIYQDGIGAKWWKTTKNHYYQKELEHIGQQEVYNRQVKVGHATPNGIFGYADRYREYREEESRVSGEFRSTLDHWHMARQFAADPALNNAFVSCDPDKRIHADQSSDALWMMANHSLQARRLVGRSAAGRII